MLTLAQIKNSSVANVAGVNVNDPQFIVYVNDAVRQLVELGEWWGTVKAMVGMTYKGCMVWPSTVGAVYATNVSGRKTPVSNYWYEFIEMDGHWRHEFQNVVRKLDCHEPNPVVRFSGTMPVFNPPTLANPFQVQVTCDNPADYGQTITIYGQDTNGLEVTSTQYNSTTGTNTVQRGYLLTLAATPVFTTTVFSNITAVTKSPTVGIVRLWVYTPTGSPLGTAVATYCGWETSPQYLFSDLRGVRGACCDNDHPHYLEALVKLNFQPVAQDSDLIIIDNLDAIKTMIQSVRSREAGDSQAADESEKTAVRRLNAEMRTRYPFQQTPINLRAFGTAHPRRAGVGQVI